jgi:hypothetical protein
MKAKPLMLDLCCGLGGWSKGFIKEGWRCVGVDLFDFGAKYPGEFIQYDLLAWEGWRVLAPVVIMSSTPCEEFSRHDMPWTRRRNPPSPDLRLWKRSQYIAAVLGVPIVMENVRGAQIWVGKAKMNCGKFYLWGDVPAIIPALSGGRQKQSFSSTERARRAEVPEVLSRHIARCFYPKVSNVDNYPTIQANREGVGVAVPA